MDHYTTTFLVRAVSYALLTVLTWKWLDSFDQEISYVWRKQTYTYIKLAYSVARYAGLISQIINSTIVSQYQNGNVVFGAAHCRAWYNAQLGMFSLLLLSLEVILGVRVYALFSRSRVIACILSTLIVIEICMAIVYGFLSFSKIEFGLTCLPTKAPTTVPYFIIAEVSTQLFIWLLTCYKHLKTRRELGWTKVPLLSMIIRDSSSVFIMLSGLLLLVIVGITYNVIGPIIHTAFPGFISITSISTCKIVLNMLSFSTTDDYFSGIHGPELTSFTMSSEGINVEQSLRPLSPGDS